MPTDSASSGMAATAQHSRGARRGAATVAGDRVGDRRWGQRWRPSLGTALATVARLGAEQASSGAAFGAVSCRRVRRSQLRKLRGLTGYTPRAEHESTATTQALCVRGARGPCSCRARAVVYRTFAVGPSATDVCCGAWRGVSSDTELQTGTVSRSGGGSAFAAAAPPPTSRVLDKLPPFLREVLAAWAVCPRGMGGPRLPPAAAGVHGG